MTIRYVCHACDWTGDHINQTDEQVRLDYNNCSYRVALCPVCPNDVVVDQIEDSPVAPVMASRTVDGYIIEQINGGFTAEVYAEYGVNASQVTHVANRICLIARGYGQAQSEVDGIAAFTVGDSTFGLMGYLLYGEDCTVHEWLDAIGDMLRARFDEAFYTQPD